MQLVNIEKMVKRYPMGNREFTALKNINLKFEKGEFTGLIGPSGSGKTTLLNIIGALDTPTEGNVTVLDKQINNVTEKEGSVLRKKSIGFIFQTFNLIQIYTVFENVELPLLLLGESEEERKIKVMQALEWVGLSDKADSEPQQLSGGESQRAAIARAIVKKPELILVDEPTANLDAENSHNILKIMRKLNDELNTTFIFATHDEKVIQYLKRKIVLIDGQVSKDEVSGVN